MAAATLPKQAVLFSLVFALAGASFGVGGLSSLQANTPDEVQDQFKPYNFMWFLGVLELVSLGLGIWAVVTDWHCLQAPVLSFLAIATAQITPLIADNIYKTAELPGSGGAALRGNITIAGLLWAIIGNFFVLLATLWFNVSHPAGPRHPSAGITSSANGSGASHKNLDAAAGV